MNWENSELWIDADNNKNNFKKQAHISVVRRTTWIYKDQGMRDWNEILTNLNMKNGQNTDLNNQNV